MPTSTFIKTAIPVRRDFIGDVAMALKQVGHIQYRPDERLPILLSA
jgi:hypothetical protein